MKFTRLVGQAKILGLLSVAALILSACGDTTGSSSNRLSVGYDAKATDCVDISSQLVGLMNYNGKTAEQLFALRARNTGLHPELLQNPYNPSAAVFQIDSKSPWWGLKGYLFHSCGVNSTDGLSRESPFFGNPYLLVAPEFYGSKMHWSDQRFSTAQAFADNYPLFQPPASVKMIPKEKREEVVYNLMNYYNSIRAQLDSSWAISDLTFDLNAYNAEDFGYNYIYVDPAVSNNMGKLPPDVIKIDQTLMVKHKESCAPGCNDIDSPEGMKGFKVRNVPARCHLLLWRNKPTSHVDPHDFAVDLIFK